MAIIATQLYSIITSTKEDRKLLVVMTMESRCGICPVIRKILQSWHRLRTEGEQQPIAWGWGGTLQSGMCHRLPTTVLSCTETVVSPVVQAMASALLGKSRPEAHDFLQTSLGHIQTNVCGTVYHRSPALPGCTS